MLSDASSKVYDALRDLGHAFLIDLIRLTSRIRNFIIFRLLPHHFPLYEWQKSARFYSDLRNQGSLEFTLLVYQLSVPSSYQAG